MKNFRYIIIALLLTGPFAMGQFKMLPNGNVGIGTTTPGSTLEIKGTTSPLLTLNAPNSTMWGLQFLNSTASPSLFRMLLDNDGVFFMSNAAGQAITIDKIRNVRMSGWLFLDGQLSNPGMQKSKWGGWDYALVSRDGNYILATAGASSRRYKTDITPLEDNYRNLLKLQTKAFTYKENGEQAYGFIAEEVLEAGLTNLVEFDEEGRPDNIIHRGLPFFIVEAMKLLNQDIKAQQEKISTLEGIIAEQNRRIEELARQMRDRSAEEGTPEKKDGE